MSSPGEFYKSLPPITKAYGTTCFMTTVASHLGLYRIETIALIHELVFSEFQVWRLLTNFFFFGNFSVNFGISRFRYGVQLDQGAFQRRTEDFLWMMIFGALSLFVLSMIPILWGAFLEISLVFMLVYIWNREFPNARVNIYGLVALEAFYLLWAMLALDVIFGSPLTPDLMGILAGHFYYFFPVLHPLAGGRNVIATPELVLKLVARARLGYPTNAHVPQDRTTGGTFTGRRYRLNASTGRGFSLRRFWSS